jgi:RimJ/RimL family protein N-acetyltransferase
LTRLPPPDPPLGDDAIRLVPLSQDDVPEILPMTADPDVVRFTRVPAGADRAFASGWIRRYEQGWRDGTRAGFAVRDHEGTFLGFAAVVDLDLGAREGEIGYMVVPEARGRGVASRTVELLTRWCFDVLALERLELRIDTENTGSAKVAERAGYSLDGVLRNVHVKDGRRADVGVWSRLARD